MGPVTMTRHFWILHPVPPHQLWLKRTDKFCLSLKEDQWNKHLFMCERCERVFTPLASGPIRRTEKNTNQHTFFFVGVCMQQALKARAEQKSLVVGLGRLILSYLQCTAYKAHLPNWGVHNSNVQQWQPLQKTHVMSCINAADSSHFPNSSFFLVWLV